MSKEAMKLALEAAYLAGFNASGEGYNGENPFRDHARSPAQDDGWCQNRDAYIRKALAEQPAPMIRGDIRDGLVDDEPAQSSKPFDTHAAPGQSFDTHSRTPQQEPVGKKTRIGLVTSAGWDSLPVGTEFYTSPPARKPLSNFAKAAIYAKHFGNPVPDAWYAAINDLEAAHGIKGDA